LPGGFSALRPKPLRSTFVLAVLVPLLFASDAHAVARRPTQFKVADGTEIPATFFDSRATGPGALFLQDCDGDAPELDNLAGKITASGPRALLWYYRPGGNPNEALEKAAADANAAWQMLISQTRVGSDRIGIVAIGCGARIAVPLAAKTGKVKLMALISPDLQGVTDEQIAAMADIPLLIFANDGEADAKRLFAATHHDKSQLKLYRRPAKGMGLYKADGTLKGGIDDYFEFVYGGWAHPEY
jgi:dienelactone hydrolase